MRGNKMSDNYVVTDESAQSLIDYYKIAFLIKFDETNGLIHELFKVLKLNIYEYDEHWTSGNYNSIRDYDEGTQLLVDPKAGKNQEKKDVKLDYFILELKGEGCRAFESRGGNWKDLFEIVKKFDFQVGRIDIAVDDFEYMDLDILSDKIIKHEYTSIFRGTAHDEYDPIVPDKDNKFTPHIRADEQKNNKTSWSATFGSENSQVQLQFYDKFQEREYRGVEVAKNQWIRCEMRFRKEKGMTAFVKVYKSLCNDNFNLMALSLLHGLIEFKEPKINGSTQATFDYRVRSRYDIWSSYNEFLQGVAESKVKPSDIKENPAKLFEKRVNWFNEATANTLLMMFGADPENFMDNLQKAMIPYLEDKKFGFMQRNQINHYRLSQGKDIVTLKELIQQFNDNLGCKAEIPTRCKEQGKDTPAEAFSSILEENEQYQMWCDEKDKRNGDI